MEPASLHDYAVIGDCRSAALISRFGSIDWLCWPRFDSGSFFAAILDPERGGFWRIAPVQKSRSRHRYLPESNVLETILETAQGAIRIVDAMSIASEEDESKLLLPEHEIVRFVECIRGELEVETVFEPRPGYATDPVAFRNSASSASGWTCSPSASSFAAMRVWRFEATASSDGNGCERVRRSASR